MKKSQIVSYTSEELKQMRTESDWDAADAMTEDEINAAIASDPEESALGDDWMERGTVIRYVNGVAVTRSYRADRALGRGAVNPTVLRARVGSATGGTVEIYGSLFDSEQISYGVVEYGFHHPETMTTRTNKGELIYQ